MLYLQHNTILNLLTIHYIIAIIVIIIIIIMISNALTVLQMSLTVRGVTIHIPCNLIQFRLLPFDFDYFDSIMQNIKMFFKSYNIIHDVNNLQP